VEPPFLSVLVVSYERETECWNAVRSALDEIPKVINFEIKILDNGSSRPYSVPPDLRDHPTSIDLQRSDINLGCPGGRNFLALLSERPFGLFLDDDGIISSGDGVPQLLSFLKKNHNAAVITGKIHRANGVQKRYERPWRFKRGQALAPEIFEVQSLLGGFLLVDLKKFNELGGYRADSLYGYEEPEFSMRLATLGYRATYSSLISFEHRPSENGRQSKREVILNRAFARVELARGYLGFPFRYSHLTYTVALLAANRFSFRKILKVVRHKGSNPRASITLSQVRQMSFMGTRLWF